MSAPGLTLPTGTCSDCRYWSDMVAKKSEGAFSLEALCLSGSAEERGEYTRQTHRCAHWAINDMGAVDEPGLDPQRYRLREAADRQTSQR